MDEIKKILLTGATGYVGGHLLKRLERDGYNVNCLVRNPRKLTVASPSTTIFHGDLLDASTIDEAFADVDCAYYMVHSMGDSMHFEARERDAAENFVRAARRAGIKRIVYLGGLGDEKNDLSPHLRSRHTVGRILRRSGIPTIELRASIVLGAGSVSFEMIRSLTEHLPVMVTPKWVSVEAQPIAIDDLLEYLAEAMNIDLKESMIAEIGGTDRVSYQDLMKEYARQRNLRRIMLPVPFLTPGLSSHWLGIVTPLYADIGRHLIEGVRNRTVVEHPETAGRFKVKPCGMATAIAEALEQEQLEFRQERWLRSFSGARNDPRHRVIRHRNLLIDYRRTETRQSPDKLYDVVSTFGGSNGMFAWKGLWRLRAFMDRLFGGTKQKLHADSSDPLKAGDDINFFHVELLDRDQRIRLKTDMKLPGEAWLEFGIEQTEHGSVLHHVVMYEPKGLSGLLYWYVTYPVHAIVFRGMHSAILRQVEAQEETGTTGQTLIVSN
jgi:uncharacterized protein YbjT (DUF2867 family)